MGSELAREGAVGVALLARRGGYTLDVCRTCGRGPATLLVRRVERGPRPAPGQAPGVARWHYCAAHRVDALCHQAQLIAAAAYSGRRGTAPLALPFPFPVPAGLRAAAEHALGDRMVALYWHGAADVVALQGSRVGFIGGPGADAWWGLVRDRRVAGWLREWMVELGAPGRRAIHHLVLDQRRLTARVLPGEDAAWLVSRQAGASRGRAR
jgi:hypothetical protein